VNQLRTLNGTRRGREDDCLDCSVSKRIRQAIVRRSPQKIHDRSHKDSQQRQSSIVGQTITAKDSRRKPQGFAAKAVVSCSLGDHRSRKDSQQKQSSNDGQAITAKDSRQKPQGFAAKAIVK